MRYLLFLGLSATLMASNNVVVDVGMSYSGVMINTIPSVDIQSDPLQSASVRVALFPDKVNFVIGYSHTLNTAQEPIIDTYHRQAQSKSIELGLSQGVTLLYQYEYFTTTLTPTYSAYIIDTTNTSVGNHFRYGTPISANDQGIISTRVPYRSRVEKEHYEIRQYLPEHLYLNLYYDRLTKPFGETLENFYDPHGDPIALVYNDATFTSLTVGMGQKIPDYALQAGWNLSHLSLDIGYTTIDLTSDFKLDERLAYNFDLYRGMMGGEIAYKFPLHGAYLVLGFFGTYTHYYIDEHSNHNNTSSSNQDTSVSVSDDFFYGVRATLGF